MKRADFERCWGLMMSGVAAPSKRRSSSIDRHTFIVGLDAEYVPEPRELLSIQFAMHVNGQLVSSLFEPPAPLIDKIHLIELVSTFFAQHGIEVQPWRGAHRLAFICHASFAELGVFDDPLGEFEIWLSGKGYNAFTQVQHPALGPWKIWFIDLYSIFSVKLSVIGATIGLPKIDIDIDNIARVKAEDPELLSRYGRRDAEIAFEAFHQLRTMLLAQYGIDALNHPTPAAIGAEIYKQKFFRVASAPYRTTYEEERRKNKDGTWKSSRRLVRIFEGNRDVRDLAIRTLHQGRNEAFIRGLYARPVVERDVRSMYPHAALGIGLPNRYTAWVDVRDPATMEGMEGFAHVRFRFRNGTVYPCIPARTSDDRLFFPLSGESYSTFAEVRLARQIDPDVEIEVLRARGFTPRARELDHDIGNYMRELLGAKKNAQAGSLERQFYKDLLNQPLGRFAQKASGSRLLYFEKRAREYGFTGAGHLFAHEPHLRSGLKGDLELGSLWAPEQIALIWGKSRALIGEIVNVSRAFSVSTDSVIIDAQASVQCPALDELVAVGSEMPVEVEADALFIGRARQYALLKRSGNVTAVDRASNDAFAVVKIARQGTDEGEAQFADTILRCIAAGENVAPARSIKRLLKPEAAAAKGKRIGCEEVKELTTKFNWDDKRVLINRDCPIFRTFTATRPYETSNRREGARHSRLVRAGEARRRSRPISESKRCLAVTLANQGMAIREIARQLKISKSSAFDIIRRHSEGGGDV